MQNKKQSNSNISGASNRGRFMAIASFSLFVGCALTAGITTYFLYYYTREILEQRLKERLIAIVNTAAFQFSADSLNVINNTRSYKSEDYKSVVSLLQLIRNYNENVRYAYILAPTQDASTMIFLADADSLNPNAKIDLNGDGIIDDDDALVSPGEEYDVAEIPALASALEHPVTDDTLVQDQWGTTLSAYAPIKQKGATIAVLGIDVDVTDYLQRISATFIPFAGFVAFLLAILAFLTFSVVRMWRSQIVVMSELDQQKDDLLSMVSHQLAAPITSFKWYLELLLGGDVGQISKEQTEYLKSMQSISIDLGDLVNMILDVSRIQLGKLKVDSDNVDLEEFFKEILDVIKPRAYEKKINFSNKLSLDGTKGKIDKRLTRMAVENLLTNAIKYTPEAGSVKFEVKINKREMFVLVSDTGFGIPKNDQDKIFSKLFRATNVRSKIDGNGFGLYISKGAIESQGGKIWYESSEGKGTTFYITLPI